MADARAEMMLDLPLNAVAGSPFAWLPDASGWICRLAPSRETAPPAASAAPAGPVIEEHAGGSPAPARTNPDLLRTAEDEQRFAWSMTSELALLSKAGQLTRLGVAGMMLSAEPSPDGRYILVQSIQRPFSRLVPYTRFPMRIEILDMSGKGVMQLADLPLAESLPLSHDAVRAGPRAPSWRADRPATLGWLEAADGGDPALPAEMRDRVCMLDAPFREAPVTLVELALRCHQLYWGNEHLALVREEWRKTRTVNVWRLDPGAPGRAPTLLFSYGQQDRYRNPGSPMMRATGRGGQVLLTHGSANTLLLSGPGAGPQGDRPLIAALNLDTGTSERLWQSSPPNYEAPLALTPAGELLFTRESASEPPNLYALALAGGEPRRLTAIAHPAPALATVCQTILRDPLLLIHGQADENEGTFTLQSERLYQALKGLGAPARLVLLPCEGHAYRARESVMHMLWETEAWLERHLRASGPYS